VLEFVGHGLLGVLGDVGGGPERQALKDETREGGHGSVLGLDVTRVRVH
jgi:hypothetical protein